MKFYTNIMRGNKTPSSKKLVVQKAFDEFIAEQAFRYKGLDNVIYLPDDFQKYLMDIEK